MPIGVASGASSRPDTPDLETRLLAVNRERLRRARDNLTPRQQDFLDLLPLLFHINHALLPGYVSQDAPAGIVDYSPSSPTRFAAKRISKSFAHDNWIQRRVVIRGIYVMGSPGTIAQTRASDLDIWICHSSELERAELGKLAEKAERIEHFAAGLGLEVHFFVFDAEHFRAGQTMGLSAESSGTSQHFLLLDEFYRSGMVIAGLSPLWWRVPPGEEQRYDDWVVEQAAARALNPGNYVDFGGLTHIPAEEFFGAAVWQLYKSITSPYKSLLKLLLMEVYAKEYPNSALLSHRYKDLMTQEGYKIENLDPYLLMYRKIEEYLQANGDRTRLEVLRRSFYLKANERLSVKLRASQYGWKRAIIEDLVCAWGWDQTEILRLDQQDAWKVEATLDERRDLIKVLQQCYAKLSDFARRHATDKHISQTDLNVLGHKLYAAFEKKPGKIDIITRGFCADPTEADLSLHQLRFGNTAPMWCLYKGVVGPNALADQSPLKRARSVVEIIAWCHFNGLVTDATAWHIYSSTGQPSAGEVHKTRAAIRRCFPSAPADDPSRNPFSKNPRLERALVIINAAVSPFATSAGEGVFITSDRTDAFEFGAQRVNLVRAVDLVLMTSWGEIFTYHYAGPRGVIDAFVEYSQWWSQIDRNALPKVPVGSFSDDYGKPIGQRIAAFFQAAERFLCGRDPHDSRHYVVELEQDFYRIHADAQQCDYELHPGYGSLVKALGQACPGFTEVRFDRPYAKARVLPAIYAANTRAIIQVFAQPHGDKVDVYILDGNGKLFVQRRGLHGLPSLFEQYERFLLAVSKRRAHAYGEPVPDAGPPDIRFYEIKQAAGGGPAVQAYFLALRPMSGYSSIRVFADVDAEDHPQFTVLCDDREFSTLDHGGRLFLVVAEFILSQRRSLEAYPAYITDLELSTRFRQINAIESDDIIQLLNYKKRIEYQLTNALRSELIRPHSDITAA